jgi:hypothetical protein
LTVVYESRPPRSLLAAAVSSAESQVEIVVTDDRTEPDLTGVADRCRPRIAAVASAESEFRREKAAGGGRPTDAAAAAFRPEAAEGVADAVRAERAPPMLAAVRRWSFDCSCSFNALRVRAISD